MGNHNLKMAPLMRNNRLQRNVKYPVKGMNLRKHPAPGRVCCKTRKQDRTVSINKIMYVKKIVPELGLGLSDCPTWWSPTLLFLFPFLLICPIVDSVCCEVTFMSCRCSFGSVVTRVRTCRFSH